MSNSSSMAKEEELVSLLHLSEIVDALIKGKLHSIRNKVFFPLESTKILYYKI